MKYKDLTECLACGSKDLSHVLDLGWQPLANTYPKEPNTKLPCYPLETNFCKECSHVQLSIAVEPDEMFRDYLYVSGTSQTLRDHHERLAKDVVQYSSRSTRVLDIGCNDGTLMRGFLKAGAKPRNVWGVDPAMSLSEDQEGLNIITAYWNSKTAWLLSEMNIVTALNVFPHNANPLGFLKAVQQVLTYQGRLVIEMPYAPDNFLFGQFDQVYHEHVSYFSALSLTHLADRAGMQVINATPYPVFGGSMRYVLTPKGHGHDDGSVRSQVQYEFEKGYELLGFHEGFAKVSRKLIDETETTLRLWDQAGYYCVAYGAAAKLSVVINAFKDKSGCPLNLVVDDNPLKQGRFTPGLDIPIASPEALSSIESGLLILCGAQNYLPEIKRKLRVLRPGAKDVILTTYNGIKIEKLNDEA